MIVVIMGVSGVGKTTLGERLAARHGWSFYDADDYHSKENVEKMGSGVALTDDDRWPWLDRLNGLLRAAHERGGSAILACSALKEKYRERLSREISEVRWVYLNGAFDVIEARLNQRKGHYMSSALLKSQFAALEAPHDAIELDVAQDPETLIDSLDAALSSELPRR